MTIEFIHLFSGTLAGDLTVLGNLTVDGNFIFGDAVTDVLTINGQLFLGDNIEATFGNTSAVPDVGMMWNTAQTVDAFYLGLSAGQNTFIIAEYGDKAYDFAHGAQTHPTLFLQSANQSATEFAKMTAGGLSFGLGLAVTATEYSIGRDADATNQLHFNVPTGSGFEWSINDVAKVIIDANGTTSWNPSAVVGGALSFRITPAAHTGVVSSISDFMVAAHTMTVAGNYALQNFSQFSQPTITSVGVQTVTEASTLMVMSPTIGGAAIITNASALKLGSTTVPDIANIASSTFSLLRTEDQTVRLSTATQVTSIPSISAIRVGQFTIGQSGGAVTVDMATSVAVMAAPLSGSSVTLSNSTSLYLGDTLHNATVGAYGIMLMANGKTGNANLGSLYDTYLSSAIAGSTSIGSGGTITNLHRLHVDAETYTASGAAIVTWPATLYIGGAPVAGANVTFSNPTLALWVDAGATRLDSLTTISPAAETSGVPTILTLTAPAHTGVTAATEIIDINFNLARNVTWAAGAGPLATQRSFLIQAPTYVGNAGGALTITDAYTVHITGAPIAGANMTLTRAHTLGVDGSFTLLTSGVRQFSVSGDANSQVLFRNPLADQTHTAFQFDKTNIVANANNKLIVFASNGNAHTYMRADNGSWVFGGAGSASDTLSIGNGSLAGILDFTSTVNANQNLFTQFKFKSGIAMTLNDTGTATPKGYNFADAAFTSLAASTEFTSFNVANSSTITFATGALALQRSVRFQQPTYASVGGVAMTITDGINVSTSGAPSAGAGVTITRPTALIVTGVTSQRTSAAMELSNLKVGTLTTTLLNTTQVTSAAGIANARFLAPAVNQSGGAVIVDTVANIYVDGALTAGGGVTLTNNYAIFSDSGTNRFDGNFVQGGATDVLASTTASFVTNNSAMRPMGIQNSNASGFSFIDIFDSTTTKIAGFGYANASATPASTAYIFTVNKPFQVSTDNGTTAHANWALTSGALTLTTTVTAAGGAAGPTTLKVQSGAHTGVGADTINFNVPAYTMTASAGYIAQHFSQFGQPTVAGAFTITNAITVDILAPTVSTGQVTNTVGLNIGSAVTGVALYDAAANTYTALQINTQTVTLNGVTTLTGTPSVAGIKVGTITVNKGGASAQASDVASFYVAGAMTAGAGVTLTRNYSVWVDAGPSRFDGAIIGSQGTDIASAATIVIPTDGNVFELTGTTGVTLITKTGYQEGFRITLIANENVTITHGTATSGNDITILLSGSGNFAMTANDTLTLVLSSTTAGGQAWREVSRTVI